jgi:hypothetical protein
MTRQECPVSLGRGKEAREDSPTPWRILVVLQRSRLVREPPAAAASKPQVFERQIQPRTSSTAARAFEKRPSAPPNCVVAHFPVRCVLPVLDGVRRRASGSWRDVRRVVFQQRRVEFLRTEGRQTLGRAYTARPPPPARAPNRCLGAGHPALSPLASAHAVSAICGTEINGIKPLFQSGRGSGLRGCSGQDCPTSGGESRVIAKLAHRFNKASDLVPTRGG